MLYSLARSILFQLDAELVHEIAIGALTVAQQIPGRAAPPSAPGLEQEVFGIRFANPVGLAAGFDKNARLPHLWHRFGFGFAELGTITAKRQPGNPKPRLFRLPEAQALINRLGFNNEGAETVATQLAASLGENHAAIPIGINIGKSATTALEEAASDYRFTYDRLAPFADYVAINVSSPNTRGLRSLQAAEALAEIVDAVRESAIPLARRPPLLVKLAPDLDDGELAEVVEVVCSRKLDGMIATNTTLSRDGLAADCAHRTERGGLSGRPLTARSTEVVRTLFTLSGGEVPIIGVGGIFDAEDAADKILAGASLVQMYTGFIYGGPQAAFDVVGGLPAVLAAAGCSCVADAVGARAG